MADEDRRKAERDAKKGDREAQGTLRDMVRRDLWSHEPGLRWVVDDQGLARAHADGRGATLSLGRGDLVMVTLRHGVPLSGAFLALVRLVHAPLKEVRKRRQQSAFGVQRRRRETARTVQCACVVVLDFLEAELHEHEPPKAADQNDWETKSRWVDPDWEDCDYGPCWRTIRTFPDDDVVVVRREGRPVQ